MEVDLSGLFISVCGAILSTVLHSLEHPVVIRRFAYKVFAFTSRANSASCKLRIIVHVELRGNQ